MTAPILVTKLFIPPTRTEIVQRPGLIDRLTDGLDRKLTLLSAPAGFGKTTLVSHWVENLRSNLERDSQSIKVAWLSLDEDDNDPVRFLNYFIVALNQNKGNETDLGRGALSMLQSPQPPPPNTVLISLINDLAAIPEKIIFILDDYHLIEADPVHQALVFLLDNIPPQLHLVIATRQDPPLSLSRLRARDQITELRAADLRFTSSEAADFLNQVMGLNLSSGDIAELETRTEGWIAGLQLAAISMRGYENRANFIKSFTGGHRLVLDFLIEEVLGQQPESIQNFLLQTSILDRMTGLLCDAVRFGNTKSPGSSNGTAFSSQETGQETLKMLDHANLFIVPLDEERRWYRYHHLFGDLLRQRLRQTQPDQLPILQRQASKWCQQNGFIDEAIEYTLRAGDFEQAAGLIGEFVDARWPYTDHIRIRRWLSRLPDEVIVSHPHLCILLALHLNQSGRLDEAEQCLRSVEQILENEHSFGTMSLAEPDLMILRGRAAVTRAGLASYQGDIPGIIRHANQALECLPEHDATWRSLAYDSLGIAYSFMGEVDLAYQAREKGLEASRATGNIYMILFLSLKLVVCLRDQGRLQQALDICHQQQLEIANETWLSQTAIVGWLYTLWGEVLAEINELEEALRLAKMGTQLTERCKDMQLLGSSYLCILRILFSRGDFADAEGVIRNLETIVIENKLSPWIMNQIRAWQARLWLVQGDLDAASQWVEGLDVDIDGELAHVHDFDHVILARIFIAQERLDETFELLQRMFEAAEAGGRISKMVEILILQALAFKAGSNTIQALAKLKRALTLAEPGGFIRTFVDEGQPMASLLYEALNRGISPEYVQRLLAAFPVTAPEEAASTKSQVDQSKLIEPLSEREIEVLQLIAKGLTNQVIATRLVLSPHTIKTHTRNIYSKLAVNNRTQAVDIARTLGILPPI